MANLALGFGELLAGGVLIAAAITGASLPDVAQGKTAGATNLGNGDGASDAPADGSPSAGASTSTASAPAGTTTFDGKPVANWIAQALTYARANGWTGTVSSGYRSDAEQTAIYNSGVRPAAVPKSLGGGGSNHEGDVFPLGAVDVTNAAQLSQILLKSPWAERLVWAGSKDPVHFSFPHNGSY